MSKRYSIDQPAPDSDIEEDIVLGNFNPNSLDRDLLRADEAVLEDLNMKDISAKKKGFFSRSRNATHQNYSRLVSDRPIKKSVGFADARSNKQSEGKSKNGYAQLSSGENQANSEDSDSDYPSDIEIDIRSQPRRNHLRNRHKKLHGLVLGILLLFGLWFAYTNFLFGGRPRSGPAPKALFFNGTHEFKPTTVVVSLDGFHPHYINDEVTPYLHELLTQNSGAPYMTPSFPSSTFPNHWTMVTGLYPSNHGIVGNTFFDSALKTTFFNRKPAQSLRKEFWGGEPIWQTASFQGVISGIHMWPGSEVDWETESPIFVDKFNKTEQLDVKVNRVFTWLDEDNLEHRPELIMAYVPTVDTVGHLHGINGEELIQALKDVDNLVGGLMNGIESRNLTDIVNLVVVSDHGMAPTSNKRLIYLDELIDMGNVEHIEGWPLIGITPKAGLHLDAFYNNLKDAQNQFGQGKWDVYLRENLPEEWKFGGSHYNKYSSRIAPLWLIPRVGWSFTTKKEMEGYNGNYKLQGVHGYNNTEVLMRALFVAKGPYFSNDLYEPFENVGLYNILCDTLGIEPSRNDGLSVRSMLKPLANNWTDKNEYPGVPFETEILDINSTYDTLFGAEKGTEVSVESPIPTDSAILVPTVHENKTENIQDNALAASFIDEALPTADSALNTTKTQEEEKKSFGNDSEKQASSSHIGNKVKEIVDYMKGKVSEAKDWAVDTYNSWHSDKASNSD